MDRRESIKSLVLGSLVGGLALETVTQKSPSSPVTPTIDPVQTSRYADPFVLERGAHRLSAT